MIGSKTIFNRSSLGCCIISDQNIYLGVVDYCRYFLFYKEVNMKSIRINLMFAPNPRVLLVGEKAVAIALIQNLGNQNLSELGVRFFLNRKQISNQLINLPAGKTKAVAETFTATAAGQLKLKAYAFLPYLLGSDQTGDSEIVEVASATYLITVLGNLSKHTELIESHSSPYERISYQSGGDKRYWGDSKTTLPPWQYWTGSGRSVSLGRNESLFPWTMLNNESELSSDGYHNAVDVFDSLAQKVGSSSIESVSFGKNEDGIYNIKVETSAGTEDINFDDDGNFNFTFTTVDEEGDRVDGNFESDGHGVIIKSFHDDQSSMDHSIITEYKDGEIVNIQLSSLDPEGNGILTIIFPDGTSETHNIEGGRIKDTDNPSNGTDQTSHSDNSEDSGDDSDDTNDDSDDNGSSDETADADDGSEDYDSGSDVEIDDDSGTAMTFDDGGGPQGSDTPGGPFTSRLVLDMLNNIRSGKTTVTFNKAGDPPALVVGLAGDEASGSRKKGMGGHGPDVRWVFSSLGPEANPIDPMDEDHTTTGKVKPGFIPVNPLVDPMEMSAISKANAEISISPGKGASIMVTAVGGSVQKLFQKGGRKFWSPLKRRSILRPGSIICVNNKFGGFIGVGNDFTKAILNEWQKLYDNDDYAVHILNRVEVTEILHDH
jgi:hypothetical protein